MVEEGVLKRWYDGTSGKSSWLQLVLPQLLREEVLATRASCGSIGRASEGGKAPRQGERTVLLAWDAARCQRLVQVVAVVILVPLTESEAGNSYVFGCQ